MQELRINGVFVAAGLPKEFSDRGWINMAEVRIVDDIALYGIRSRGDLYKAAGITDTFDWAVPQDWADKNPAAMGAGVVWMYDKQSAYFGRPFPDRECWKRIAATVKEHCVPMLVAGESFGEVLTISSV